MRGEQKINFFKELDIFVLPSISLENDQDGIPVVLMEAIAASLPLISTNVSGIPEICIDNYNGFLIEEKNVNQLVDATKSLVHNTSKRLEFSKNSFSLSKEYDISLNSNNKILDLGW